MRTFLIIISIIFISTAPDFAWENHFLGGGNTEKIIIVDDTVHNCRGAWFFDKNGGDFWLPWENSSSQWGNWQNFNANTPWHMGGDVFEIDGYLYAVSATMEGHHIYKFEDGNWNDEGFYTNGYYQYHDAMFIEDNNGFRNVDNILLSAWQVWPAGFPKGLYIRTGSISTPLTLIPETFNKAYPRLHRDLDDNQIFYTWNTGEINNETIFFKKLEISGTGANFTLSLFQTDFTPTGYSLKAVSGFYQYKESSVIHQYLLAETQYLGSQINTIDVWYRNSAGGLLPEEWIRVWQNINLGNGCIVNGLYAKKDASANNHTIISFCTRKGIVLYYGNGVSGSYQTRFASSSGDYFCYLDSHYLTGVPWIDGEIFKGVLVGIPFSGNDFVVANVQNQTIFSLTHLDQLDNSISSDKQQGSALGVYADNNSNALYSATWSGGLVKMQMNPFSMNKICATITPSQTNSDYNFRWNCIVQSPFNSEEIYAGCNITKFPAGTSNDFHHGVWKFNIFNPTLIEANAPWQTPELLYQVNKLAADYCAGRQRLFIACPNSPVGPSGDESRLFSPAVLYVQEGSGGNYDELCNTQNGLVHINVAGISGGLDVWPEYISLKVHPNPINNSLFRGGILLGSGLPVCDYSFGGSTPAYEYYGGEIALMYKYDGGWISTPEVIIPRNHQGLPALQWFKNVMEMVTEYNSAYYGSISADKYKVDILAATAAYQPMHGTEDIYRYGGLFKVIPNSTGTAWETTDITPYRLPGSAACLYKLENADFENPAVNTVYKKDLNNSYSNYYCVTSGEASGSSDDHLLLIWYQTAHNIRELTRDSWQLYPNPSGEDGRIPITEGGSDYIDAFYNQLMFVGNYFTVSGMYIDSQSSMQTAVSLSVSGNDVTLHWNSVPGALEYKIYYQSAPYFTPSGIPQETVIPPNTSWTDTNALNQSNRYYRVVVGY